MATNENEAEVKDIERVEIAPAEGENVDDESETQSDSSQTKKADDDDKEESKESESEESEDESDEDGSEETKPTTEVESESTDTEEYGDVKPLPGETKREFALRIENARLRGEIRSKQTGEILTPAPVMAKKELPPEKKKVLEKYKPEDINTLKEVFDVMADDMGFVRKDQLNSSTYQEKAGEVLDEFLEKHPEYQPQNDKGSILWNRFKAEFAIYKSPDNPRALKQILNKVHKEVFGIKPIAALNKNEAAKEKLHVASHTGSSRPAPSREGVKRTATPQGLRTDMLKGFTDEEIADLTG